jgi:hypothetical protein
MNFEMCLANIVDGSGHSMDMCCPVILFILWGIAFLLAYLEVSIVKLFIRLLKERDNKDKRKSIYLLLLIFNIIFIPLFYVVVTYSYTASLCNKMLYDVLEVFFRDLN